MVSLLFPSRLCSPFSSSYVQHTCINVISQRRAWYTQLFFIDVHFKSQETRLLSLSESFRFTSSTSQGQAEPERRCHHAGLYLTRCFPICDNVQRTRQRSGWHFHPTFQHTKFKINHSKHSIFGVKPGCQPWGLCIPRDSEVALILFRS